jgi:hypothetical protein
MGWFEESWPWVPAKDACGHPLGPGLVNFSYVACKCPAATDDRGHQQVLCRIDGCPAPPIYPPEHTGTVGDQR